MLKTENLTIGYGNAPLLKELNLSIGAGECVLLAGANGTGKSTFLKTLAGLVAPISGKVTSDVDLVFVPTGIPKVKGFSVRDFVNTSFFRQTTWAGRLDSSCKERTEAALHTIGIERLADRDISSLSDGEFQKVCIASAIARLVPADGSPSSGILLLDEPTSFLDVDGRAMLLETLNHISHKLSITVIFSSHDIHSAVLAADRVLAFLPSGDAFLSDRSEDSRMSALTSAFSSLRK